MAPPTDATTPPDAAVDENFPNDDDIFGGPLCLCGCVQLDHFEPDASCAFDYVNLRADEFHHELQDIMAKIDGTRVHFVPSSDHCSKIPDAFFVDDNNGPKTLTLCPAPCERLRATGSAVFGRPCGEYY